MYSQTLVKGLANTPVLLRQTMCNPEAQNASTAENASQSSINASSADSDGEDFRGRLRYTKLACVQAAGK